MKARNATVAVVGAGDYIGAAIAKRFAAEGYLVVAGRRNGDKLQPLKAEIEAAGGRLEARTLDARSEEAITAFLNDAESLAPLDAVIFNVGANVRFPLLETTERVYRKVWEMAAYAGFLTGREAARLMGVSDAYRLPASESAALKLMGDAVAVPVVRALTEGLLSPVLSPRRAAA